MKKVFYFLPSLDVGGVEVAIMKALPNLRQKLDISIFYVRRKGSLDVGQLPWWRALKNIFVARPDVVITSLWSAHPVGFLFKLAGIRWVCFIHSSRFVHFIDRLVCTVSIWFSNEIAADSEQTAEFVGLVKKTANVQVVPCMFPLPQCATKVERIRNSFIYVGRNSKEKRMDLVTGFFKHLLSSFPNVTCRFVIAGDIPAEVLNLLQTFGKRVNVELNPSNSEVFNRLCASEYFVVLSDFEGFCMTAYEAVQAGCFVIYRDAGEIKKYVIPQQSFKVTDLENSYSRFDEILVKRNETNAMENQALNLQLSNSHGATYISYFIVLVEGSK